MRFAAVALGCILGFLATTAGALLAATGGPTTAAGGVGPSAAPRPGFFVVSCPFSHRNNDDPIVFPGEPGRSHDHSYFGNTSVDAHSTPASLRGGETTCSIAADAAGYWTPTLYVGRRPVVPYLVIAYYGRRTPGAVKPFPADLRMVAGNANARRPQRLSVVSWSCGGVGPARRSARIPRCPPSQPLRYTVEFPNCWNGRDTDSPDHTSHVAYSQRGQCPASHPVAMVKLVLTLYYTGVPVGAQLSSGKLGGHADFMNGWDQDVLLAYTQMI
jgi:Domain of unknown function (DUF1996)